MIDYAKMGQGGAQMGSLMAAFGARFMGPPGAGLFRCGAGHAISVDAYGRAQPCMGVRASDLTVDVAYFLVVAKGTPQAATTRRPSPSTCRSPRASYARSSRC